MIDYVEQTCYSKANDNARSSYCRCNSNTIDRSVSKVRSGWWWQATEASIGEEQAISGRLIQEVRSINCNRNNNNYMFYCKNYCSKQDDERIITSNSRKYT